MKKLFDIQRKVISGQCKGALLRLQIGYNAIFLFPDLIPGWAGSSIGIFAPRRTKHGYKLNNFYLHPWLAPDKAVCELPKWYRSTVKFFTLGDVE